jgi:hypothetical protein
VCEEKKIAYYWLSKEEKENHELRQSLRPEYGEWKKKGYKVCVFLSGKENIVELTKELLIHNKEVLARENVRKASQPER